MRTLIYPADDSRCGRRIVWPAETLISQGADIVIADRHKSDDPVWNDRADVVVLQRPMLRRYVEPHWDDENQKWNPTGVIQILQNDGMKVVVDIDDDFMALNHKNGVWERTHPAVSPDCNWQHLSAACRMADLVTVTTPALARRYGSHGRVVVIPNHIPQSYLEIERPKNDVPVVGWSGAVATHPDDLQVTRGAVSRALQQTGAQFYMVGPPDGVQANLGLSDEPVASGWIDIDQYPFEMAKIDVGIIPLEMSKFNQAKSYLKGLEFAALGIPYIASPTTSYVDAWHSGAGMLAHKPKDWERMVRSLTDHPGDPLSTRRHVGERGREWAATQTIEGNAHLWQEAWEMAYNGGRKLASIR